MRDSMFLRARPGHEKPAVVSGGLPDPAGSNHVEKDTTNMTAVPLFNKPDPEAYLAAWLARGRHEVFTVTTTLTPGLARSLLANNPKNRPVKEGKPKGVRSMLAYAAMMKRGEWMLNGSTIVVAATGELNDGQHRCEAVIAADVGVPVQITFGVERDTQITLDQGIARTSGNVLAMRGVADPNHTAVYLRFRLAIERGHHPGSVPSPHEMTEAYERFRPMQDFGNPIKGYALRNRLSVGFMIGAHALCAEVSPAKAAAFAEQVATGVGLPSTTVPAARFRKLVEDISLGRATRSPYEIAAAYVEAFNLFSRGRSGPFKWRTDDAKQAFPTPVRA